MQEERLLEDMKRTYWVKAVYSIEVKCFWGNAYYICPSHYVCTPSLLGRTFNNTAVGQWMEVQFADIFGLAYNILFGILIIIFTYFYTAITVPTNKMADDLKRSGGFIPGIRPGKGNRRLSG